MANNYFNYTNPTPQNQTQPQMQQMPQMPINSQPNYNQSLPNFFLQPIGSIYNINTASEINQVPASSNLSVGLCLSENIMYIKSFQNGAPMLLGYRLSPIEGVVTDTKITPAAPVPDYEERFKKIENAIIKLRDYMEEIHNANKS